MKNIGNTICSPKSQGVSFLNEAKICGVQKSTSLLAELTSHTNRVEVFCLPKES